MEIDALIRENVRALEPYAPFSWGKEEKDFVRLDSNENPFPSPYNRYPDPYQRDLKEVIADLKGVDSSNLFLGNGSDECIDLLIRLVCVPGKDNLVIFPPTYAMYEIYAQMNDVEVRKAPVGTDFQPEWEKLPLFMDNNTKLLFFCTPGNPVGNVIPLDAICRVAETFPGLVVVDEAYLDFSDASSAVGIIEKLRNVVVLQTLSKAWGAAGLRVGICMAHPLLVEYLNKMKPPYNISSAAQQEAIGCLNGHEAFRRAVLLIRQERERLKRIFCDVPWLQVIGKSEANFLLVSCPDCTGFYHYLLQHHIVVRLRQSLPHCGTCLRITVGTPEENDKLIQIIKDYQ